MPRQVGTSATSGCWKDASNKAIFFRGPSLETGGVFEGKNLISGAGNAKVDRRHSNLTSGIKASGAHCEAHCMGGRLTTESVLWKGS